MSAFRLEDADAFFGREVFLEGSERAIGLVNAVQQYPIVGVIGSSGSGKSSVIFAGLLPKLLIKQEWLWISFRPGNRPFYNLSYQLTSLLYSKKSEVDILRENSKLAKSLREQKIQLSDVVEHILRKLERNIKFLLIVDQLEELYTLCQSTRDRECFLQQLLSSVELAAPRSEVKLHIVFTLRADFYGYVLAYRPFRDVLQQYPPQLLSGMTREEMRQAIECPAIQLGIKLEEKLADRILDDVGEEPGNLPLMEFALTLLWSKQRRGLLTHVAYSQIGEVKQALANHAEQIYTSLSVFEQKSAQKLFLQLVHISENALDTRKIITRSEASNWDLVTYLSSQEARLVVTGCNQETGEETVEVVHEALIRGWERLRQWILADRKFRIWQDNLRSIISQWLRNSKDEGSLLRGQALAEAREWFHVRRADFALIEEEYIEASLILLRKEQRIKNARRRRTIIGLIVFSIIALLLSIVATIGWSNASTAQANAEVISQIANAETMFASDQEVEALLNGIKAGISLKRLRNSGKASKQARVRTLTSLREIVYGVKESNRLQGHSSEVTMVDISPDGSQVISSSLNDVKLWKLDGTLLSSFQGGVVLGNGGAKCVEFSPDGKTIASGGNGIVNLYEIQTKKLIRLKHSGLGILIRDVSFSLDGKIVASAGADGTTKVWSRDGKLISTLSQGNKSIEVDSVSFSPDGQTIATGSGDSTPNKIDSVVKLWKRDGTFIKSLSLSTMESEYTEWVPVTFSPNGQLIATAAGSSVQLWSSDGSLLHSMSGHSNGIRTVAFSPDSQIIASGGYDNTIKLWRSDGTLLDTLKGHNSFITSLRFSPDGEELASSSQDSTIRIWKIKGQPLETLSIHPRSSKPFLTTQFFGLSPDGKLIVTTTDNVVAVWKMDGSLVTRIAPNIEVTSLSFSPDGKIISIAGISGNRQHKVQLLTNNGKLISDFNWKLKETKNNKLENKNTDNYFQDDETIPKLSGNFESEADYDNGPITIFSPNKKRIFSFGGDDIVRIWSYDGKLLSQWEDHRAGIGAYIGYDNNTSLPIIARLIENSPASFAGLKTGDQIIEIDGISTKGLKPEEISYKTPLHKVLNRVGETVSLKVLRNKENLTVKVTSVRANISPSDVWTSGVISPRKNLIILGSRSGIIKIFKLDGTLLKTFNGHTESVSDISINEEETIIASTSTRTFNVPFHKGSLKLWEIDNDSVIGQTISETQGGFASVSFNHDGDLIAAAPNREDSFIEMYQIDGSLVGKIGEQKTYTKLQFSPDGKTLVSAGRHPFVILWNFDLDELLSKGCSWLEDYLNTNQTLSQADRNTCQKIMK
ncbi:MAG: PDZ domain-containing protein [Coleofasciculus sp. B1-GNL1-01]|uniref:nSTAND1 domain-containing NTPase n=1 Tax=Coleofasciculus sp. B1-GNL1-01 TaxID=3068484 RepID=UPI0032F89DD4